MRFSSIARLLAGALCAAYLSGAPTAQAVPLPATVRWDDRVVVLSPIKNIVIDPVIGGATWLGFATEFVTTDPIYACLNQGQVSVWSAPGVLPNQPIFQTDDPACAPGTWVEDFSGPAVNRVGQANDESGNEHGAPRIDIYLTDTYGTAPCTREVLSNNTKKYVCRTINYSTTTIPKVCACIATAVYVYWGEDSGGDNYTVTTKENNATHVYEGCVDNGNNGWRCVSYATNIENATYLTKGKWFRNAFERWYEETGNAVQCTAAIYNQDAQGISEDCLSTPA